MNANPQYIATDLDNLAIYGIGDSPEAALADAKNGDAEPASLVTYPATIRLAELVLADGGAPTALGNWTTKNVVGLADLIRDEDETEEPVEGDE